MKKTILSNKCETFRAFTDPDIQLGQFDAIEDNGKAFVYSPSQHMRWPMADFDEALREAEAMSVEYRAAFKPHPK